MCSCVDIMETKELRYASAVTAVHCVPEQHEVKTGRNRPGLVLVTWRITHHRAVTSSPISLVGTTFVRWWPRPCHHNVHLSNTLTTNVLTLGLRATYNLQSRSLNLPMLPPPRHQEIRVMESVRKKPDARTRNGKPRSSKRNVARSGRAIGRVFRSVFLISFPFATIPFIFLLFWKRY